MAFASSSLRNTLLLAGICLIANTVFLSAALAENKATPTPAPATPTDTGLDVGNEPGTDIVCQADVYFTWQKKVKTSKDAQGQASHQEPAPPVEVFFATVGDSGLRESDIRARIDVRLASAKSHALDHCRSLHQDQTSCFSARLKSHASEYGMMDYAARKTLIAAINDDCSDEIGACLSASSKEIRCFLNRPPTIKPPAAEISDGKKDQKKDEKKKK